MIGSDTLIPLGVAVAVATAILIAIVKLIKVLDRIDTRLVALESRINEEWTIKDQRIWELELRNHNPTLNVPNSYEVARQHQHQRG